MSLPAPPPSTYVETSSAAPQLFAVPPSSAPPPPLQPTNPPASIQISRAKIPPSASLPRRLLATRDDALWKTSPPSDAGLDPVLPPARRSHRGKLPAKSREARRRGRRQSSSPRRRRWPAGAKSERRDGSRCNEREERKNSLEAGASSAASRPRALSRAAAAGVGLPRRGSGLPRRAAAPRRSSSSCDCPAPPPLRDLKSPAAQAPELVADGP
jgi:hypothetical protein